MGKRRTIGSNPLDAVIPTQHTDERANEEEGYSEKQPSLPRARIPKERLTVHLPIDLIDRVKNVVYWTPGLTLAGLAQEALARTVDQFEKDRGEPFPPREQELKGGRPIK